MESMKQGSRIILPALFTGVAVLAFIHFRDRSPGAASFADFLEHTILPIAGFGASAYLALGLGRQDRDS